MARLPSCRSTLRRSWRNRWPVDRSASPCATRGTETVRIAGIAFLAPALSEELVFRAALIPGREERSSGFAWITASTVLFTLWHVIETVFLPGGSAFFRRFDFLVLAALLGLLCGLLRWRSGSVWSSVFLHWLAAVAWIGWFGGPSLTELR
ncbi:MAG: CPBP family intramembrane metalloprotease [Proteobacteria bacterium]|nr:CPBP family intramembrane metalloprotease [Pseudomonadota bacterium]